MKRGVLALTLILLGATMLGPGPTRAEFGFDEWRMRVWVLPAMANNGNLACLTNNWHGPSISGDNQSKALDWKANCNPGGDDSSVPVRFRMVNAAPDDIPPGQVVNRAMAEPTQVSPNPPCGTDVVRVTRVKIRSTWDDMVKGKIHFGHAAVRHTTPWQMQFRNGADRSTAYYQMAEVGDTRNDEDAGPNCWNGWHTHVSNSTDPGWDWNSDYTGADVPCECYVTDDHDNWTRRLFWIDET